MGRYVFVVLLALWALDGAPARAAGTVLPRPPAEVRVSLTSGGGGFVTANSTSNPPGETWTWQMCDAAGAACAPFGAGRSIESGAPPAGVTFRASSNTGLTALSPTWNGPLRAPTVSGVAGTVRANRLVGPIPQHWEGGWPGDFEQTQLSACPTSAGVGCIALTGGENERCDANDAVIDPDFAGWYLQVASVVYGPNTAFVLPARTTLFGPWPYLDPVWTTGPTTALSIVGRIGPATGPRAASCGPPPLVQGLPPQVAVRVRSASLQGDGAATVRCYGACSVDLHAASRGRHATTHLTVTGAAPGIRISPRQLKHLGHGPIRYTLFVDGHRAAQQTIRS